MNKLGINLIIILILISLSCKSTKLEENKKIELPCSCEKKTIELYKNGRLKSCKLDSSQIIDGIPCGMADISFFDDGKLKSCYLSKPVLIDAYKCVGNYEMYENGKLKHCDHFYLPLNIQGYDCKEDINFFEDGKLKSCVVKESIKIKNLECNFVEFYKNYNLKKCRLAKKQEIDKKMFCRYNIACFDEDGKNIDCSKIK